MALPVQGKQRHKSCCPFFADRGSIFLAQPILAVVHLKIGATTTNSDFMTITNFLEKRNPVPHCDVLVIDDCSKVNNRDMVCVLQKDQYILRYCILTEKPGRQKSKRFVWCSGFYWSALP